MTTIESQTSWTLQWLRAFGVCMALMFWGSAGAQITFEGCRDINGVPVGSEMSTAIGDIAIATIAGGRPMIFYNPQVVAQTPASVRLFFYAHECGHHKLGHILQGRINIDAEQEADCFGIRLLVERGVFKEAQVSEVQRMLHYFGRGDWSHLPGPRRAINLRRCLAGSEPESTAVDDAIQDCIDSRAERCIRSCRRDFDYSETACRSHFCNPEVGSNVGWARACRNSLR
jgi:hypothetical protein